MQYLIHDLMKLSLEDRLRVIEQLICSIQKEQNSKIDMQQWSRSIISAYIQPGRSTL